MGENEEETSINPNRVGIRMDVMKDIISDLNDNPELQKIFGTPVSKYLVVVADNNDLRLEDGGVSNLSEENQNTFLGVLEKIIKDNSMG